MSATAIDPQQAQRMRALLRANTVRSAASEVKAEIERGELAVVAALSDPRAGAISILDLLRAQPRWGKKKAKQALSPHYISESRKVRELTPRQRELIIRACR